MWEEIWQWDTVWWLLVVCYIPCCIGLIVIVLLQKGKGTGFAGAFGIGAGSDTVFGPRGGKSLPARMTYGMATAFMVCAVLMSLVSGRVSTGDAPDKVEDARSFFEDLGEGQAPYDDVLDDLGTAVAPTPFPEAAADAPMDAPPEEPAAATPAAATPITAPAGTVTVTPVEPAPADVAGDDSVAAEPADQAQSAPEPTDGT